VRQEQQQAHVSGCERSQELQVSQLALSRAQVNLSACDAETAAVMRSMLVGSVMERVQGA
jgi:hypothetical protein